MGFDSDTKFRIFNPLPRYTFDDDKIEELERLEAQGDLDDFTNEQNQSERNEPPSEPTQE